MSAFLITFFTVYGSIHLYFFLKLRSAFPAAAPLLLLTAIILLILMCLSPILVHIIESYRQDWLPRIFAQIGYSWMGFLFFFLCLSLLGDFYTGVSYLSRCLPGGHVSIPITDTRNLFLGFIGLSLLMYGYGIYEARHIKTEHLVFQTDKLPPGIRQFRIVQISDLHLGITTRPEQIRRTIEAIRETQPHLLVCTGDLIDGQPDSFAPKLDPFRQLSAPYGKYAVTGNHEFYVGLERAVQWLRWSGFTVLQGTRVDVAGFLNLAGVDDHEIYHPSRHAADSKSDYAMAPPPEHFTLFLKHKPVIDPKMATFANLQLSGHTHRGQIFPFGLITRLFFPYHSGLYTLTHGFQLYVSRGTGTWGPPIRFLSPPEITIIDLVPPVRKDDAGIP